MVRLRLYKTKGIDYPSGEQMKIPGYELELFRPSLFKLSNHNSDFFVNLFWFISTFGKYKILYVKKKGDIAHYSYIISNNIRFPFMKRNDLQIGPCFTYEEFRGNGIYSRILKIIPSYFPESESFWIYTAENNSISRNIIEKSGFDFIGTAVKSGVFRIISIIKL